MFVFTIACVCLAKHQTMRPALAQATTESRLIDVDVVDTSVKNLLSMLASTSGVSIGVIGELRGAITLSLHQRTPEFVLQVIADTKGMSVTKVTETTFVIHQKDLKVTVFSPAMKN